MDKYTYALEKIKLADQMITKGEGKELHVHTGICGVTEDIKAISKEKNVSSKTVNYKFRGVEDAQKALNPLLPKHGISITEILLWHHVEEKSVEKEYNGKKYVQTSYYHLAEYMYVIQSKVDGSRTIVITMGECNESSDKGCGKTSSYAWKNMAFKTFAVPTEEDNDPDKENNPMKSRNVTNKAATKEQLDKMVDWAAEREIPNEKLLDLAGKKTLQEFTVGDLGKVHKALLAEGYTS